MGGGGVARTKTVHSMGGFKTLLWLAFNALTTRGCSKTCEVGERYFLWPS